MAVPMVYMDNPKVHVFDSSSASGWVVLPGPKCYYMTEPKYVRFITNRFVLSAHWDVTAEKVAQIVALKGM
jgi:hypothetical protein